MEALWTSGSLRSGVSLPGSGSSATDSPWRRHEVKPGAVWEVKFCIFIKETSCGHKWSDKLSFKVYFKV